LFSLHDAHSHAVETVSAIHTQTGRTPEILT